MDNSLQKVLLQCSRRHQPRPHLAFRLPASRTNFCRSGLSYFVRQPWETRALWNEGDCVSSSSVKCGEEPSWHGGRPRPLS